VKGTGHARDRNANHALYQVVLVRMASSQRTKDYVNKRTAEGKSKPEIMRCLKRYAAREEIYRQITNPQAAPNNTDLRQKRSDIGLTLASAAAGHLGQWPTFLFRLERGFIRNDELATSYRQWLTEQTAKTPV
jgi:hypothetical protein